MMDPYIGLNLPDVFRWSGPLPSRRRSGPRLYVQRIAAVPARASLDNRKPQLPTSLPILNKPPSPTSDSSRTFSISQAILKTTFTAASWIWTSNSGSASTSPGNVAFLELFQAPASETASSAVISITAVGNFMLWVNGQPIGASNDIQNGWNSVLVLRAALNPEYVLSSRGQRRRLSRSTTRSFGSHTGHVYR
ncbi:hypothetical protein K438DRAFT_1835246 [Mycena galopus ATCC 62051]|nr:hypothetical protein K438DRAFT_1835246 [Mycena galopus ATCC 62051]